MKRRNDLADRVSVFGISSLRRIHATSELFRALTSSAMVFAAYAGGMVGTLIYTVLLVHLLSPSEFGAVSSIWALALLLMPLGTLNIGAGAIRSVVQARQAGDDALAAGFVTFARRIVHYATPFVIAIFLGLIAWRFPDAWMSDWPAIALVAASITMLCHIQLSSSIGVALDQAVYAHVPRSLVRPVLMLVALASFDLFDWPLDISTALILFCATAAVNLSLQSWLLRETFAFVHQQPPRMDGRKEWLMTGMSLLPERLINEHAKNIMIVAAAMLLSLDETAVIIVALSMIGVLNFSITAVDTAFASKLSNALQGGHVHRFNKFLAFAGLAKLAMFAVMAPAILLVLDPLLKLFGHEYQSAKHLAPLLMMIPAVKVFFGKAELVLLVHDLRRYVFGFYLFTLFLLPSGGVLMMLPAHIDPPVFVSLGFVIAFAAGYIGLWWTARTKAGIDTSLIGAVAAFLRTRQIQLAAAQ